MTSASPSSLAMAEPIRLCIVNPFQHGGGAEYQISCLIDVLGASGRFDIAYLARHTEPGLPLRNYKVVKIGGSDEVPKFGYLTDALPLYRALQKIQPQVIYQRVACGYTGVCAYYARRHGARLLWHVAHESDVMPDSAVYGRNPVRRFLEKRSVEYAITRASHIVTQTQDQARLLMANYGRQASAVIPNFHPEPTEMLDKDASPLVVWVANLKPWKRPDAFVRLANRLQDLAGVRFVMVGADHGGSGNQEWHANLMNSINGATNLEYLGQLSQSGVNELLARAHVFVNTSDQEGFPNTFIQAWMRRVPVVSLTVDPDDVLKREQVGVHAGTEERMVDAVRMLVTDSATYEGYAARGRQYALSHHSMRNAFDLANLIAPGVLAKPVEASTSGNVAIRDLLSY